MRIRNNVLGEPLLHQKINHLLIFAGLRPGGALAQSEVVEAPLNSKGNRGRHEQRAGSPPGYQAPLLSRTGNKALNIQTLYGVFFHYHIFSCYSKISQHSLYSHK
ncbi:hypothetical protein M758_3G270100 [Ceratodon purpureus]|uniref:Uncharacterized protein n=1 Tax=Ceratodon purpureus TaxID=3225 RepID=A0A8T0IPZ0_CERPU|nr:hypothetical protein KC19_3G270300 [Ceratodon purpureus]KAG0624732.1 hypothetical protein M758_3G270100 [Ceratodon purpureus]